MKNSILLYSLLWLFSSCIVTQDTPVRSGDYSVQGDPVPFTEREIYREDNLHRVYEVDFNRILVDVPIPVEIVRSYRPRVEVYAPPEVLERLLVESKYGQLIIRFGSGFTRFKSRDIQLVIHARDFYALESTSSVDIRDRIMQRELFIATDGKLTGDFEVEEMRVEVGRVGNFRGSVWSSRLELLADNASHIELSGQVSDLRAEATGSAVIEGIRLSAEVATLRSMEKSGIRVAVSESADAVARDKSMITIYRNGDPSVNVEEYGSGRVVVE